MDRYPITGRSLEWFFDIDGDLFERQYKHHLSGYWQWKDSTEGLHAERWRVFPQNIGPRLSIDETSLSRGELYTIVTNKDAHGRKNGSSRNSFFAWLDTFFVGSSRNSGAFVKIRELKC